ncbi:N-acetylgalactosamine 6-sulfate sulfatase (GALNS) [Rhodopirellula europaea SH398]|uniref:N-acetylgalactosamine 6-sulfate sulfatase (GALNS) n=1 Tax=Rhodopirellula europaea SH398 TaxID=1263868 RepID=M5S5A2_9BACT|nr:N-acetylgalactosamine 6-sulfate sulfatase (GALNS) [Rhodopirellula europaea SH398]
MNLARLVPSQTSSRFLRSFPRWAWAFCWIVVSCQIVSGDESNKADSLVSSEALRPNIIYVMADDLGYGDLGCYGQTRIQTPHLDQMAADGIRFTDHYAGHTVCRPSRLTLWTGKHVGSTGLIGNAARNLTGEQPTVASLLSEAGYATGGVGKWALGNVDVPEEIENPGHPLANGFDAWTGYMHQSNAHNYYPPFLWKNYKQSFYPGNVISTDPIARGRVAVKRETYSHDVMTDAAFDFIREHQSDPFLLHVHWTIPHANNEGGRLNGDGMEVPDYGIYADEGWPNPEKGFAAMITRMDRDMGRMMALLAELNLTEKTLVIFTSDNGPHHEGGHSDLFFNSSGPLQGSKRSMHEGGIRVPFIAKWPGTIEPNSISDHPSAFWDFLPTACELAGAEPPADIDGVSYLPALLNQPEKQTKHRYLYWASSEGPTSVGLRSEIWKAVNYPGGTKKRRSGNGKPVVSEDGWKLFDLSSDPGEKNDVSKDHPEELKRLVEMAREDGLF